MSVSEYGLWPLVLLAALGGLSIVGLLVTVGARMRLAGGAGLSTIPGWVRLSTCAWPPAPAIAGALHRWAGGYGHATEAHRSVVTAIGAVDLDWPSQAAEAFGGAS